MCHHTLPMALSLAFPVTYPVHGQVINSWILQSCKMALVPVATAALVLGVKSWWRILLKHFCSMHIKSTQKMHLIHRSSFVKLFPWNTEYIIAKDVLFQQLNWVGFWVCGFWFLSYGGFLGDRVCLCSSGCSGTFHVDQAGLQLRDSSLCLSSASMIKGMVHHQEFIK